MGMARIAIRFGLSVHTELSEPIAGFAVRVYDCSNGGSRFCMVIGLQGGCLHLLI